MLELTSNNKEELKNKKLVFVDFWASWCKPCREETLYLVKLYEQFKDKGLTIVGVFVSDKKENLKKGE